MVGRAVECGGLENRCGGNSTGGSNPSPSASIRNTSLVDVFLCYRVMDTVGVSGTKIKHPTGVFNLLFGHVWDNNCVVIVSQEMGSCHTIYLV